MWPLGRTQGKKLMSHNGHSTITIAHSEHQAKNGRKFPKRVENTVGKGEIARYKQFLLFPRCFQKPQLQTRKSRACLGKG